MGSTTARLGLSAEQRSQAVTDFDARFGEMDKALWCLSRHCRSALIAGQSTEVVEALVWTIRSWWGVQGVRAETKGQMAAALAELVPWSQETIAETVSTGPDAEAFAFEAVSRLVEQSTALGVPRREFSLASKVLHWLLPWRVPVYDTFVRRVLGIPGSWDHPRAYREVVSQVFAMALDIGQDLSWAGGAEPVSPLHALDKCLWWRGGGADSGAAEVRHPWRVVDDLGLRRY